jgi:hypothetical protein|eukprot:COSAG01_NODE_1044_length_11954_cov_5.725601_10_plen_80_part_00
MAVSLSRGGAERSSLPRLAARGEKVQLVLVHTAIALLVRQARAAILCKLRRAVTAGHGRGRGRARRRRGPALAVLSHEF